MNDFEYDCLEKKRLARQARYRKRGSRGHKCVLSSDFLTKKQWKERNGKVVTINLNTPMLWADFKALSPTLRSEYIKHLVTKYGVTAAAIARMMGVSTRTLRKFIWESGIEVVFRPGRMTNAQSEVWQEFLTPAAKWRAESNLPSNAHDAPGCEISSVQSTCVMDRFSIEFSGGLDLPAIFLALTQAIGSNPSGSLKIIYQSGGGTA